MDTLKQSQHKHHFTSLPAAPTYPSLRPARSLASLPTPAPEQVQPVTQAQLDHAARFGHSLANIAIFPTAQRKAVLPSPPQEENQLQSRILAARSDGHPLEKQTQQRLEQGLGADLSGVRVHTGSEADHLARSINATAFTTGTDIFFRAGTYHPGSLQGLRLLAHEATHVVQQASGPVAGRPAAGGISISDPGDRFEQIAEASANRMLTVPPFQPETDEQAKEGKHPLPHNEPSSTSFQSRGAVQRVIGTKMKVGGKNQFVPFEESEVNRIIEELVDKYGEGNRAYITSEVARIHKLPTKWTERQVVGGFSNLKKKRELIPFIGEKLSATGPGGALLPRGSATTGKRTGLAPRRQAIKDFAFTSVTTLVGTVGDLKFETRNETDEGQHAEEKFTAAADREASGKLTAREKPKVTITINNSPCHGKCARHLVDWKRRHGIAEFDVHYMNPYGTQEEFLEAKGILEEGGITVSAFTPLDLIGSDTEEEIGEDALVRMRTAQERAFQYQKDVVSEGEESAEGDE